MCCMLIWFSTSTADVLSIITKFPIAVVLGLIDVLEHHVMNAVSFPGNSISACRVLDVCQVKAAADVPDLVIANGNVGHLARHTDAILASSE